MSQLKERLQQALEDLKAGEEVGWLKELMEWLLQELLELEFTHFLGAERYQRTLLPTGGAIATAIGSDSCTPG